MDSKVKAFISFRFSDGHNIKEKLITFLEERGLIIDKSEDKDRRGMSEETIQQYLFEKLKDSSLTIVLLTPQAITYRRDFYNRIDDWLYDELRYSLYDRGENRRNAVIALYTPQTESSIFSTSYHYCDICKTTSQIRSINQFDNLIFDNIFNVKNKFKKHTCDGVFDRDYDSYISLIKLEEFYNNPDKYIEIAKVKRKNHENYEIKVRKN